MRKNIPGTIRKTKIQLAIRKGDIITKWINYIRQIITVV